VQAIELLRPEAVVLTPSSAAHVGARPEPSLPVSVELARGATADAALAGATRERLRNMPFAFEQPNLDSASESQSHLYFDPGDGRLITVFTNEERAPEPSATPREPGFVHHLAFSLSQATFRQAVERLDERGIRHSGVKDRGHRIIRDRRLTTSPLQNPSKGDAVSSLPGHLFP